MSTPSKQRHNPKLTALGLAIRRLRLKQGISQEQLALLAEVNRSYIGEIERAENSCSILALVKIAGVFQITAAQLLAEAGL